MLVYALNINGQPLMPTSRFGKVSRLLKTKKAEVIKRCPFTIELLYETTNITQSIKLGVDAGSKEIGLSATTQSKELYASEVTLRNDVVELLSPDFRTCLMWFENFLIKNISINKELCKKYQSFFNVNILIVLCSIL